jgi:hypothetical protein
MMLPLGMTKTEMQKEIIDLHKALKECILTDSQRVAIRNEIGELEDQIALLEFEDQPDIDWGFHSEWE